MDFGFKTFRVKGSIERQFGIAKAPALLIMKEGSYAPVIQTTLPKSHKVTTQHHTAPWHHRLTTGVSGIVSLSG